MNTITKSECEAIIDKLADKTLSFGCRIINSWDGEGILSEADPDAYLSGSEIITWNSLDDTMYCDKIGIDLHKKDFENLREDGFDEELESYFNILGHPVLIGNVMNTITKQFKDDIEQEANAHSSVCFLWKQCGFTKSLNQILEEAKIEEIKDPDVEGQCCCMYNPPCSYCVDTPMIENLIPNTPASNLFLFLFKNVFKYETY